MGRGDSNLAGTHVSWGVGKKSNTHGRGWLCRRDWRRCALRIETADLHIAISSISTAVIGRVARAGCLAVFDRPLVVGVGDQVGTPAILVLDNGKGVFSVGAVAVTTAVALPVVVDCQGKQPVSMRSGTRAARVATYKARPGRPC
jgi:hypothetical protein